VSSPYLTTIFRIMVGLVFLYTALNKITNTAYFAGVIYNYQLLPDLLVNLVAVILPWVELICGFLLILGFWYRSAALIISFLMTIFLIAITSVMIRGLDIECGCFGSDTIVDWPRIIEDIFLLIFSLQIVLSPESKLTIDKN
jgi:putative oxidoreductase